MTLQGTRKSRTKEGGVVVKQKSQRTQLLVCKQREKGKFCEQLKWRVIHVGGSTSTMSKIIHQSGPSSLNSNAPAAHRNQVQSCPPQAVEEHCTRALSQLQQSWQESSLNSVREHLVSLAATMLLSPGSVVDDDDSTLSPVEGLVQKGLFRIIQRHYTSYRKGRTEMYDHFSQKFDLLIDIVPLTFCPKSNDDRVRKSFVENIEEEGVQVLIHLLRGIVDRHIDLFPSVLKCFQKVSLSGEAKANVLNITLSRLSRVDKLSDLPFILSVLGELPADEMESFQTISGTRQLWRQLEKQKHNCRSILLRVAREVTLWFSSEWNGHFLATAYLQTIDETTNDSSTTNEASILILDVCVLLALSTDADFGTQSNHIFDSWVGLEDYSESSQQALSFLKVTDMEADSDWESADFCHNLVQPMMNLAVLHLRACKDVNQSTKTQRSDFCMSLFDDVLQESDRPDFVNAVVDLWKDTLKDVSEYCPEPLYRVLRRLSERNPELMMWHRDAFVDAIESSSLHNLSFLSETCAIIALLYPEGEEILEIVDRLLFSPVDCHHDNRIASGIILCSEVIRNEQGNFEHSAELRLRVLQIILPSDRRVVSPRLGSHGLAFLEIWPECSGASTFRDVQMILANTGLIQRYSSYKQAKRKYSLTVGYAPKDETSVTKKSAFIFCAAFFLRQVDSQGFDDWKSIVRWVFDLVDSYLGNGLKRSAALWNPRGWLQARVEFPVLAFPFNVKTKQQKKVKDWILNEFGNFDVAVSACNPPPSNFRTVCTEVFLKNPEGLEGFRATLNRFALGLLVGVGLSAAVLKNAFAHYKGTCDGPGKSSLLKMIEGQINKIYHLKDKIVALEYILGPLEAALRKLTARPEVSEEVEALVDYKSHIQDIAGLREVLGVLHGELFCTAVFMDDEILWEVLSDDRGSCLLRDYLGVVLSPSLSVKIEASDSEVLSTLQSKSRIALQLVNSGGSCVNRDHIVQFASFSFSLLKFLPGLRGALSDMDSPSLSSWVSLAATTVQLLTLWLEREVEQSSRLDFVMSTFSPLVAPGDMRGENGIHGFIDGLQKILQTSDDVHVSNGLLEMLSIVCTTNRDLAAHGIKASSEALRTTRLNSGMTTNTSLLPFSLVRVTKAFKAPTNALPTLRKSLEASVCRALSPRSRIPDPFSVYRFSLLRHFGLLMLDRSSSAEMEGFLGELIKAVESVLKWLSRQSKQHRKQPSPTKTSKKVSSPFPNLKASNFAEFFDAIVHMTIGAIILYPPVSKGSQAARSSSPYHRLEGFFDIFLRLTQVYTENYAQFPRQSVATWYMSSRVLMDATSVQLGRCAEWRSSQQLPKTTSSHDPGSLQLLGRLIRSCYTTVGEGLYMIAETWGNDKTAQVASKGAALKQWVDRFSNGLEEISSVHALPDTGGSPAAGFGSKRRRVATSKDATAGDGMDIDDADEDFVGEESEDDDGDDSFGAAGAWGNDASADEDSVSSVRAITIHRTV